MVTDTIIIPESLIERIDAVATKLALSREDLIRIAIENYSTLEWGKLITEQLNRIYAEEYSEVDPVLAQLQWLSLPKEEWK